jgi:hypothetical protein
LLLCGCDAKDCGRAKVRSAAADAAAGACADDPGGGVERH